MIEIKGDLFAQKADVICVTTNGFVKFNGECVMGKGCAQKAAKINSRVPLLLGNEILSKGNVVNHIITGRVSLYSFPVKPVGELCEEHKQNVVRHMQGKYKFGQSVPGWACKAREDIIKRSAEQLRDLANAKGWKKVVIPRPGCGAGELEWSNIKPMLSDILDDRFYSITFK